LCAPCDRSGRSAWPEVAPGLTRDSIQQKYAQAVASTWTAPGCVQSWGEEKRFHTVWTRTGNTEQARAEFDRAIELDPHNAQALYNRGLLYQGEKQHQLAIDDFTVANGLTPQQAEPLLGRAVSYLALDKVREAAADLDEAAQVDPQNGQVWSTRGLAYERLGEKTKAASSYGRALSLRPRDEAARNGFTRVGGKPGQNYEPF
jgi:Tfp pilus assembly protein PilF